ncbi:MAG TPA: VIT1/CCC1 transporter family protein, partial [Methylomirabilota bacterium]|nr:VIT1/CCC1 transporter family protein [Methylomirabilota bacterium]
MALSITRREYDHHTEQVHAVGGPWVRDVMLGLNDGLVASFAVTSGVAGAFTTGNAAVMAGLSEMLGGAVAMGLAAFISARSQVEFYQSEIEREREEIKRWPDREREEISTIYREKGFAGPLLDQIVAHITSDPERWNKVMMREELGFSE